MTLNEAIKTVLLCKYKKDAKEAFKMVKDAGYVIYKYGNSWRVENETTNKKLEVRKDYYPSKSYIYYGCYGKLANNFDKFDYVSFLNKPLNKNYYEAIEYQSKMEQGNKYYWSRFYQLTQAKTLLAWENQYIKEAQQKVKQAEENLKQCYKNRQDTLDKLNNLRKEFGLKERM